MSTSINAVYKPQEFSKMIGMSIKTLQRWDNEGKLVAHRTPTNRRYYTHDQYLSVMGLNLASSKGKVCIYARVSSRNQKDDLGSQVSFLREFCNARGMIVDECIEDIGSGLNYNREKWNRLLDSVMDREVGVIVVAHRDRFVRFGFDWFERFCGKFGTEILVVNNETLSPQEELVQDIISILHVFSCRLYGLRKYKRLVKEDVDLVKDVQDGDTSDFGAEDTD